MCLALSIDHIEENIGALSISLTPAEVQELANAVPHEEVSGDRYPDMRMTYKRDHINKQGGAATAVAHSSSPLHLFWQSQ